MTAIMIILTILCLVFGVLKSTFRSKDKPINELFFKTCGSLTFVCLGILSFYIALTSSLTSEIDSKELTVYGLAIICALILGLLGDIFLCLHDLFRSTEKRNFVQYVGITFFFLGHIFYMFNLFSLEKFNLYLLPFIIVLPLICIILIATKTIVLNKMQSVFVVIYFIALNLIILSAINIVIVQGFNIFSTLILSASILFISSDIILGLSWFSPVAKEKFHRHYDFYIILSYYLAQCLYAMTISFYT